MIPDLWLRFPGSIGPSIPTPINACLGLVCFSQVPSPPWALSPSLSPIALQRDELQSTGLERWSWDVRACRCAWIHVGWDWGGLAWGGMTFLLSARTYVLSQRRPKMAENITTPLLSFPLARNMLTLLLFIARAFISGGFQAAYVYTPEVGASRSPWGKEGGTLLLETPAWAVLDLS